MTKEARFDWQAKTYVMGIVNVTPDSFSGDGLAHNLKAIEKQAMQMVRDGADILDVGGVSTRPGADTVSLEEELARVIPAIELITKQLDVLVSVDTFQPEVARAALKAGAGMLNDVHGFNDPEMVALAGRHELPIVVMHSRGDSKTMSSLIDYPEGIIAELINFFKERTAQLLVAGIKPEHIIIDPGIGFAKTAQQSWEITRRLSELKQALQLPILYGASRKSSIGLALAETGSEPPAATDRLEGTLASTVLAVERGANIIRVHDVKENVRTIRATRKLLALDS